MLQHCILINISFCIFNVNIIITSNDVSKRKTGQPTQYGDSLRAGSNLGGGESFHPFPDRP